MRASIGDEFVPVEIWLWLQPPSSSHETRGSQTLHLRAAETDQSSRKDRSVIAMPFFEILQGTCALMVSTSTSMFSSLEIRLFSP